MGKSLHHNAPDGEVSYGEPMRLFRLIAVCTTAYCIACSPTSPTPAPDASSGFVGFEPPMLDLGTQPWGSRHGIEAVFYNETERPLIIKAVRTTCGCTGIEASEFEGREVRARTHVPISAVLEIGNNLGEVVSTISVITNEGVIFPFHVRAEGCATFRFDPSVLLFDGVNLADERDDQVQTILFTSDSVRIQGKPRTDAPWLDAGIHRRTTGETEIVLHVVKRNLADGQNVGRITFALDDPTHPSWTLPVTVTAFNPLRAVPGHVFLRGDAPAEAFCVGSDGGVPQLVDARSDDPGLSIDVNADRVRVARNSGGESDEAAVVWLRDSRGRVAKLLVTTVTP